MLCVFDHNLSAPPPNAQNNMACSKYSILAISIISHITAFGKAERMSKGEGGSGLGSAWSKGGPPRSRSMMSVPLELTRLRRIGQYKLISPETDQAALQMHSLRKSLKNKTKQKLLSKNSLGGGNRGQGSGNFNHWWHWGLVPQGSITLRRDGFCWLGCYSRHFSLESPTGVHANQCLLFNFLFSELQDDFLTPTPRQDTVFGQITKPLIHLEALLVLDLTVYL